MGPRSGTLWAVTFPLTIHFLLQPAMLIRVGSFPFAQQYLKRYKRPPVLVIHRFNEGKESNEFNAFFGPVEAGCNCVIA